MTKRRSKSRKSHPTSSSRKSVPRRELLAETVNGQSLRLEPVTDVVTERAEITTEPEIEIRKPGTLAQALTEPATAVVKPNTKVRRKVIERKRVS